MYKLHSFLSEAPLDFKEYCALARPLGTAMFKIRLRHHPAIVSILSDPLKPPQVSRAQLGTEGTLQVPVTTPHLNLVGGWVQGGGKRLVCARAQIW